MITKVEKLSEPLMKSILDGSITLKEYNKNKDAINARCNYIVQKIMDINEISGFSWWDFDNEGGEDGPDGYFDPERYKEQVNYHCEYYLQKRLGFCLPHLYTFPTRWIWMDFEEECQQEYQKIVRQWEKSKSEMKEKKENKEQIKREALQKLTPEEREILGY